MNICFSSIKWVVPPTGLEPVLPAPELDCNIFSPSIKTKPGYAQVSYGLIFDILSIIFSTRNQFHKVFPLFRVFRSYKKKTVALFIIMIYYWFNITGYYEI